MPQIFLSLCLTCFLLLSSALCRADAPTVDAAHLAVVINADDPKSVEIGHYYQQARGIPESQMITVSLGQVQAVMKPNEFEPLRQQIMAQLPADTQAILMVWTAPYAVGCNSITSAMSLGYDAKQCIKTCDPGKPSPYFDAKTRSPWTDLKLRPSMLLPTESVADAKALIDRGVLSAFRLNEAQAYFLITQDKARNSRLPFFPKSRRIPSKKLTLHTLQANEIRDQQDVMFYFTGSTHIKGLETLQFLPGAIADHLTSSGGELLGGSQMSSLRWLEAGATGSYGTVSEPCNHWQKFPNPLVVLKHYLVGETLIEAYWKSVAWPTQGVFIGEPLAAPYAMQGF